MVQCPGAVRDPLIPTSRRCPLTFSLPTCPHQTFVCGSVRLLRLLPLHRETFLLTLFLPAPSPLLSTNPISRLSISPTSRQSTANMADADTPVTLRTRKFIRNPLLGRRQFVVYVQPCVQRATISTCIPGGKKR